MSIQYNQEVFNYFRSLAITDVEKLEVGKTYYSNCSPAKFTIKELISWKELDQRRGIDSSKDSDELEWIVYGESGFDHISLQDTNVGASYNPWLIFETEELRDECVSRLKISYSSYDDDYDDYDDYTEDAY